MKKDLKNNLQWGDHNPKLTADNFIDQSKRNEESILSNKSKPLDLSKEEPGRNRKGVREGERDLKK